jgi:hypothetical protein
MIPYGYFNLIDMGKQTFYFSHDYNARNDEKIKELIFEHGMEGYGIYWSIIEELYLNANVLHLKYERIAFELRSDLNRIKSIINDYDLFVFSGENFGSLSVQKRLEERAEKSKKATESVNKRWSNTNVLRDEYESNTIKESKIKEKKVINTPLIDEVILYFNENGYTKESAIKAFHYYEENDWKDSRNNQVKNWKQKMQGVWFKDENKAATLQYIDFRPGN